MSYNYYNPYQEDYQWYKPNTWFSCDKEVTAERTKCTADRTELETLKNKKCPDCPRDLSAEVSRLRGITCPPQRVCPPDLTSQFNSYKANYSRPNSDYENLQRSYDSIRNTTCPPQRVCPPPVTCDAEKNSLDSLTSQFNTLQKSYQDLQKNYDNQVAENSMLRSATCPPYPSCSPAFKIPDDLVNNIPYRVTKTNNGWDLYKDTRKLGSVGRNDIQLLNNNNEPDSKQKFQKLKEGLRFSADFCSGEAKITRIDNTINTIDYSCVNDTSKVGTLLSGPYRLNQAYTQIFDAVKEQLSAKAKEEEDLKNNLKKDIDFLESKIGYLKKLKVQRYLSYLIEYENTWNFSDLSRFYDSIGESRAEKYEIDSENSNYIKTRTLAKSKESCNNDHINYNNETGKYSVDDFGLQCIVSNLEEEYNNKKSQYDTIEREKSNRFDDNVLIDIINESKGNLEQINSLIAQEKNQNSFDDRGRYGMGRYDMGRYGMGPTSYGNKQKFDMTIIANIKYISILGRLFQFTEFPDQYEGKTLQELTVGDSFNIIDK